MSTLGRILVLLALWSGVSALEFDVNTSSRNVSVGEPLLLVYTFAHTPSDNAVDFRFAAPALEHFQVIGNRSSTSGKTGYEVWQKTYVVAPLQSGKLATGTAAMNVAKRIYAKDAWGQWMPKVVWEEHRFVSQTISVNPIPSGVSAFGRFSVGSIVDTNRSVAGKPVTLTVTVQGCGNLDAAELPLPKPEGVSVFDGKKQLSGKWRNGCYYTELNQTYALVGEKDFTIPPVSLRSFDPASNGVLTAKSLPISIRVDAAVKKRKTKQGEKAMTAGSLAAAMVIGVLIGVAATLFWERRRKRKTKVRYDSMRSALIALLKHMDDPEAKQHAAQLEKHLYEAGPEPDKDALFSTLNRLKRREMRARHEA